MYRQVEGSVALILGSETYKDACAAVTAAVITSTPLVASPSVLKAFPFLIEAGPPCHSGRQKPSYYKFHVL